jgi:hypothetical protein
MKTLLVFAALLMLELPRDGSDVRIIDVQLANHSIGHLFANANKSGTSPTNWELRHNSFQLADRLSEERLISLKRK